MNTLRKIIQSVLKESMHTNPDVFTPKQLEDEKQRLLATWSLEKARHWLVSVDPNGVWTDEERMREEMDPLTLEDAVDSIVSMISEDNFTPEEILALSRRR